MTKKSKPHNTKEVKSKRAIPGKQEKPQPTEEDNALDFGGLPDRNLKKNLGCG